MTIEEIIRFKKHAQLLVMHSWRKDIPQDQRNIIIAEALNSCTVEKNFNIIGYLITNRRVFLIGSSETTSFQKILQYFYEQVAVGIINYKNMMHHYHKEAHIELEHVDKLFTEYPFYNEYIRRLITGKTVELPYYDPHLERLETYINGYNYCSALDYEGGKSPVIVATNSTIR
ncbi:hypothetical protein KORDIASMS9_01469 [Kordia sp. SMS9]|uniref:hypothetical protein n=1 Tax=Kordia sp. SMS9 TaxID=2282170 RepID=UPI000E0D426D|nr:hypothetical protein [Kordia sp. SMS9]AXG69249.1 hypothetical protein KORDIASMS9_01469 [Kordia sp. SMS9]